MVWQVLIVCNMPEIKDTQIQYTEAFGVALEILGKDLQETK
jgi:hypothetical protein